MPRIRKNRAERVANRKDASSPTPSTSIVLARGLVVETTGEPVEDARPTAPMSGPERRSVLLASVRRERRVQLRATGVRSDVVDDYKAAMKGGAVFPPIVLFEDADGALLVADGFHRIAAAESAGLTHLEAEVRSGGEAEALLFAAGANAEHGQPRTAADKRRAVLALHARPEWSGRSARWIAEQCRVSPTFAADVLASVRRGQLTSTTGKDGKARRAPRRAASKPKAPSKLQAAYSRLLARPGIEPREHFRAFERALEEHGGMTFQQLAELWRDMTPKLDAAPEASEAIDLTATPLQLAASPPAEDASQTLPDEPAITAPVIVAERAVAAPARRRRIVQAVASAAGGE